MNIVALRDDAGGIKRVDLVPDNPRYRVASYGPEDGELSVVAELLEAIG